MLIVGQNPGNQEDLAGEAFIGPSGKLLVSMLEDAGYTPADYRLTNAVRCATPAVARKQRPPLPVEIDRCRIHLANEIAKHEPRVIIALGDTALRSLTKLTGVQGKRGKSFPLHSDFGYRVEVWPTYHPAFVLRQPIARNVVVADLRRVRDDATPQTAISWDWYTNQVLDGDTLGIDIETIDEDRNIVDYPTQVAVSNGSLTVASVGPFPLPRAGQILVHHNGLDFDLPKLRDCGIDLPDGYDTLVLAYLDDETQPLGLESLCVKYLGKRGWKEDRTHGPGTVQLGEYNSRDALYTVELYHELRARLGDRIRLYDHIILPGKHALDACTARGIRVDGVRVSDEKFKQEKRIEEARAAVLREVDASGFSMETHFGKPLKSGRVKVPPFNPGSTDHVGALLTSLGHKLPLTPTGKYRVDKEVLGGIYGPFTDALENYRSSTKRMSTYILPYEKAAASEDGRMHAHYGNYKTYTGRTNSFDPTNIQNLDRELKDFLLMMSVDYAAIEFRIAAWIAREQTIIGNYQGDPMWDPHRFFAALFYGKRPEDVTKAERQIAKSANFSQLYLGEEHTLQSYAAGQGITLSLKTCRDLHLTWHRTFPGFRQFYKSTKEELKELGYVESPTGRRRHFGDVSLLKGWGFDAALREAVNFKVQSFATGDLSQLALIACHREGLPICYFGHDSIGFDFESEAQGRLHEPLIRKCLIDYPTESLRKHFGIELDIPLEIEFDYHTTGKEQSA